MNMQRALPFILGAQILLLLAVLVTHSSIIVGACLVITLGLLVLSWPQPKTQAPRDPEIHDPDQVILWKTRVLDVVQQAVIASGRDGRLIYLNPFAQELYGYTPDDWPHLSVSDFFRPEDQAEASAIMASMGQGRNWSGEMIVRRKDGTTFPAMVFASLVFDDATGEVIGFVGISADISDLHQTRAALRESEELYKLITENSIDLITLVDLDGYYLYVSPSHVSLGYSPTQLIGHKLFEYMHPDDQQAAANAWSQLLTQGTTQATGRFRHADGSWRWLEAFGTLIQRDSASYIVSVARDITARVHLEAQLRQSQKMEAIGRLAGGVAHDFNNWLMVILGYAEVVVKLLPPDSPLHNDLHEIQNAAQHAADVTHQLLTVARKQLIAPTVLNLNDLIRDMDRLLRPTIGEQITLVTQLAPDLAAVRVDRSQIMQVILNLAVNARDAMPQGGTLRIETANAVLDEHTAQAHVGVAPGAYVRLRVSDSGVGMDDEVQSHIFEPFFTTKGLGDGIGLGLSTCYGIIANHNGVIDVQSALGAGTTMTVYLPQVKGDAAVAAAPVVDALPRGHETILLVEDVPALRTLAARSLRELGYRVLEAGNGVEALQVVEDDTGTIDLVVTDVVMPQMDGRTLAKQLHQRCPNIHVIYMSGYSSLPPSQEGLEDEELLSTITKPVSMSDMARMVRQVLDTPA